MGNAQGTQAGPIECDILIVGAGATGLGAAYRLNQLGYENWALVDAGGNPGGSCGTIKTAEGFRFDLSQHAIPLNSKYEVFEEFKKKVRGHKLGPKSREFSIDSGDDSGLESLESYFANGLNLGRIHAAANVVPGETTFDQFLIEKFGEKATAMLHRPLYNKKFAFPTTQIPSSYNEALLTKPTEKTVIVENDETKSDAPVGDEFLYPKQGGYSNFWKAIAKSLPAEKLHFKTEITSIDLEAGEASTSSGARVHFKYVISTMSLNKLCDIIEKTEENNVPSPNLPVMGTHYINVGVRGKNCPVSVNGSVDYANANISFHRANFISNFDKGAVPEKGELLSTIRRVDNKELKDSQLEPKKGAYWSVQFEVSSGRLNTIQNAQSPDFIEQVLADAMHCGILKNKDQIVSLKVKEVSTNNVIPILGSMSEKISTLEWLQNKKVWSRGALGSHNQDLNGPDDCIIAGFQAVDNLLFGSEETVMEGKYPTDLKFEVDVEKEFIRDDLSRDQEDEEEEDDGDEEDEESDEETEEESEDESDDSSVVVVKKSKKGKKSTQIKEDKKSKKKKKKKETSSEEEESESEPEPEPVKKKKSKKPPTPEPKKSKKSAPKSKNKRKK